jgi:hypothetical protein
LKGGIEEIEANSKINGEWSANLDRSFCKSDFRRQKNRTIFFESTHRNFSNVQSALNRKYRPCPSFNFFRSRIVTDALALSSDTFHRDTINTMEMTPEFDIIDEVLDDFRMNLFIRGFAVQITELVGEKASTANVQQFSLLRRTPNKRTGRIPWISSSKIISGMNRLPHTDPSKSSEERADPWSNSRPPTEKEETSASNGASEGASATSTSVSDALQSG